MVCLGSEPEAAKGRHRRNHGSIAVKDLLNTTSQLGLFKIYFQSFQSEYNFCNTLM